MTKKRQRWSPTRIGVISDTHGYLDPDALRALRGVSHIIHAGDIVDGATLDRLRAVAPLTAVAGNLDDGDLAAGLPREATGVVDRVCFAVGHKRKRLLKRIAAGKVQPPKDGGPFDLIVFGHEHVPSAVWVDGVLHLNPGTASSPDEEDDGPTLAVVEARATGLNVRLVPLPRRFDGPSR